VTESKAPACARTLRSTTKSPIAVAGRGVGLLLDEKIPNGIFLMEKWLPFDTGMYDMIALERSLASVCEMMKERRSAGLDIIFGVGKDSMRRSAIGGQVS